MGVHTGDAELRDGDYLGPSVNRAARVMGLARGGQVLVSLSSRKALYDDALEFIDGGEYRLKVSPSRSGSSRCRCRVWTTSPPAASRAVSDRHGP
jgi:class 3 adenylate cyclase